MSRLPKTLHVLMLQKYQEGKRKSATDCPFAKVLHEVTKKYPVVLLGYSYLFDTVEQQEVVKRACNDGKFKGSLKIDGLLDNLSYVKYKNDEDVLNAISAFDKRGMLIPEGVYKFTRES